MRDMRNSRLRLRPTQAAVSSRPLSASGPAAPPVTTLRELHALWIECGEAAWAAAAHRDEFAEAQAELLAAHVEFAASAKP
jgi:hypothetical protein